MTDAPPAYSAPGDGERTNTRRPPPAPANVDAPPSDGKGVLAAPLKRMIGFAIAFGLYYILAMWYPLYWMNSAANYCNFGCNNYPPTGASSLAISSVSSSSSTSSYYYDGSTVIEYSTGGRLYNVGCYETLDTTCEAQCESDCAFCEDLNACQDALDTYYERLYGTSSRGVRLAAWTLLALGEILALVGLLLAFLVVHGKFVKAPIVKTIGGGLLGFGGVLIAIGAIVFAAGWHEDTEFEEVLAAQQLIIIVEYLLPASLAIVVARDVMKSTLNAEKTRMMSLTLPWVLAGLFAGGLWAYYVNWDDWDLIVPLGEDFWLEGSAGCMAAGYFIVGLMSLARILVWGGHVAVNPVQAPMYKFVIAVLTVIGGFILAVGYWAMLNDLFDCETYLGGYQACYGLVSIVLMNGDSAVISSLTGVYDVPYAGQFKAYYVGYSFFVLVMTLVNAYDMDILGNYKKVRTAQQAATAAS